MKISVIMPSYLGRLRGTASQKDAKFLRAVNSFLQQTHDEKELVIISDGCSRTQKIYETYYRNHPQLVFGRIKHQQPFSGLVRQTGIDLATGEIIAYLDADDYMLSSHLDAIVSAMSIHECDWVYFPHYVKHDDTQSDRREVDLTQGYIGISNIAHKRSLSVSWSGCNGRGHEWGFVKQLIGTRGVQKKIYGTEYIVCHIRNILDL